jgi:hypothetical protein
MFSVLRSSIYLLLITTSSCDRCCWTHCDRKLSEYENIPLRQLLIFPPSIQKLTFSLSEC